MFNSISSLAIGVGQSIWNIIINIFSFIPKLMYLVTTSFLSILDIFQLLFRKLAGLDTYYVTTGGQTSQQTGDIVEEFINGIFTNKYPTLSNIFWSFIILGIIMLFVTTIVALIRNEYTPEKDGSNSKSKVIGRSLKAFLSFAIVPVVVIFGIYLCNVFLRALDAITSGSSTDALGIPNNIIHDESGNIVYDENGLPKTTLLQYSRDDGGGNSYIAYSIFGKKIATNTTPFSGIVFKASAYRANRARISNEFVQLLNDNEITNWGTFTGNDSETVATYIDNAFANNVKFRNASTLDYGSAYQLTNNVSAVDIISGADVSLAAAVPFQTLDRYRVGVVWYYYDLWQYDFIVAWAIVLSMLTVFINIIFGLMKRFFEVVGLFLVSPPVVALMPLDDGSAFGKWKGKFISKMLGAYGAVVGMNLLFIILPYIYNIKFFNIGIVDSIIQAIFVIVGLVSVKSFVALMSEIAGGDDVLKAGGDIAKEVGATVQKAGAATAKVAGFALKASGVGTGVGIGLSALASKVGYNNRQESRQARLDSLNRRIADGEAAGRDVSDLISERNNVENQMAEATARHENRENRRRLRQEQRETNRNNRNYYNSLDQTQWAIAHGQDPENVVEQTGGSEAAAGAGGVVGGSGAGSATGGSGGGTGSGVGATTNAATGGRAPGGPPTIGDRRAHGFWNRFGRRVGRNALSALHAGWGVASGLFMDMVKGTDFYKGWDEAGGGDGVMIYARGGGASDVKAYRAAKDHYKARAAAGAVEGAGDFLLDEHGNRIPERNADGSVRRELVPQYDASGNITGYAPTGPIIYQRGNRNPNATSWNIR